MLSTKFFIGNEQADFNDVFNVVYSIGDIRNQAFGSSNKTYTLNLPPTRTNRRLVKFINQIDVKSEPSAKGWLFVGELLIMSGDIKVMSSDDYQIKIIINSDEWIDDRKKLKLADLDLSAHDHVLSAANVVTSWSASYPAYRYPMINFGGLQSAESGALAAWYATDFVPIVSIATLINKILEPYTISSDWLTSGYVKDLFITIDEVLADSDFITDRDLVASPALVSDNEHTTPVPDGVFNVGTSWIVVMAATTDEGADFSSNKYTVPETGTYKFTFTCKAKSNHGSLYDLSVTTELFEISIVKGAETVATDSVASIDGETLTITAQYFHATAGDVITAYMSINIKGTSTHGSAQDWVYGVHGDGATLENVWGQANRYTGLGKTMSLEELLPDMTQIDFIAAIRDIYNLRFFTDKLRQNIYSEPWDDFVSSTVIDLTDYIDCDNLPTELVSTNYFETIVRKWKDDSSDAAYKDYLKYNTYGPGRKDISIESLFAKKGIGTVEHPFSSIITGENRSCAIAVPTPRIFSDMPADPFNMFDRKTGFNTRIVEWKGLTAGFEWNFDGDTKTTYPKIQGLDFDDIYKDYWVKHYHYIDKGKLLLLKIKLKPGMLAQFLTVVNTATSEGFRATYKITKDGIENYCILQSITSDGTEAELELILKS